jgi:hypothetical protein
VAIALNGLVWSKSRTPLGGSPPLASAPRDQPLGVMMRSSRVTAALRFLVGLVSL